MPAPPHPASPLPARRAPTLLRAARGGLLGVAVLLAGSVVLASVTTRVSSEHPTPDASPGGFAHPADSACLGPTGWTCVARELDLSAAEALAQGHAARTALDDMVHLTQASLGEAPSDGGPGLAADPATAAPLTAAPVAAGRTAREWRPQRGAWALPEPSSLALAALVLAAVTGLGLALRGARAGGGGAERPAGAEAGAG